MNKVINLSLAIVLLFFFSSCGLFTPPNIEAQKQNELTKKLNSIKKSIDTPRIIDNKEKFTFNAKLLSTTVENDDSEVSYIGPWSLTNNSNSSGSNYHVLNSDPTTLVENNSPLVIFDPSNWQSVSHSLYSGGSTSYNSGLEYLLDNHDSSSLSYSGSRGNVTIDNSDTVVKYYGSNQWLTGNGSTLTLSSSNYLEFYFIGSGFDLITRKYPSAGIINLSIFDSSNNKVVDQDIDQYNSSWISNQLVYSNSSLGYGVYKVKLQGTGTKNSNSTNYYYDFDKANIHLSSWNKDLTNHSSYDFQQVINDEDLNINYYGSGQWFTGNGSTLTLSSSNYLEFYFTGTNLELISRKYPSAGIINLSIFDSSNNKIVDQNIDQYSPSWIYNQSIFNINNLDLDTFKVRIQGTGTKNSNSTNYYYDFDKAIVSLSDWEDSSSLKSFSSGSSKVINDEDLNVSYYGSAQWFTGNGSTLTLSSSNYLEFSFTGTNLELISRKYPSAGIINLSIFDSSNNKIIDQNIDQYSPSWISNQSIYKVNGLLKDSYKVRLQGTGTKNSNSSNYYYDFDKAILQASVQYSFTGSSISYFAEKNPFSGIANVIIDGGKAILDGNSITEVDLYSASTTISSVKKFNLPPGQHYITIEESGKKNISSSGNGISISNLNAFPSVGAQFLGEDISITNVLGPNNGIFELSIFDIDNEGNYTNVTTAKVNAFDSSLPLEIDGYNSTYVTQKANVRGLSSANHSFSVISKGIKNDSSVGTNFHLDAYRYGQFPKIMVDIDTTGFFVVGRTAGDQGDISISVSEILPPTLATLYNSSETWQDNVIQIDGFPKENKTLIIEPTYTKDSNSTGFGINFDAIKTLDAPIVESVAPRQVKVGDTLIIGGKNFSTNPSDNQVFFPGSPDPVQGNVISSTDGQIKVIVPNGALTGNIGVLTPADNNLAVTSNAVIILQDIPKGTINNITGTSVNSTKGRIAVDIFGLPNMIWLDKSTTTFAFDTFFNRWAVGGWSNGVINLSSTFESGVSPISNDVASDMLGGLHAVFAIGGNIFYSNSLDGGVNWIFPLKEVNTYENSDPQVKIAVGGNKIHIVWILQNNIAYTQSSDGGQTWSEAFNVSNTVLNSISPDLAVDGRDMAYVTWADNTNNDVIYHIYYDRMTSENNTTTWLSEKVLVSTDITTPAESPNIALDQLGNPSIVWQQGGPTGFKQIFYAKNLDREQPNNWTAQLDVSQTATNHSYTPKLDSDPFGNFYVAWEEAYSGIYYSKHTNALNNTWSTPIQTSHSSYPVGRYPDIAFDSLNNQAHISWETTIDDPLYDIYHVTVDGNTSVPDYTNNRVAVIDTSKGIIRAYLYEDKMPVTTANFINLANSGFYDGLTFHRYEPGFVIQGGDPLGTGFGGSGTQIKLEVNRNLSFEKSGMLGMARDSVDDASSQFFMTLDGNVSLNGRFALFGEVISGYDVMLNLRKDDIINTVTIVNP